ncbi:adsorption protein B [Sphingobium faniae]|nr:adsorption protein B [Sphingobium faniae]
MVIAHREILLFAVAGLFVGGIDDLLIDLLFLCRRFWRKFTVYSRYPRMTTATLPQSPVPGKIAVFVPAWDESEVISPMLRNALHRWKDADYRIFVGAYPNDPATIEAVGDIAAQDSRITLAVNSRPGPTTKADCLNLLWRAMEAEERESGSAFKAVLLHDAEDVVHRDEIRLFDFMTDRFDLVQLPVLPLPGKGGWMARAITNHYCDEFAESHAKLLTVREALGAAIPSAGVACAFNRRTLGRLTDERHEGPFDPASLTEDYEAGLRIGEMGGRGIFVRMRDEQGQLVATREYFPDTLDAAIRQKARWIIGISLAGWDRLGWRGSMTEWWMRFRDRRAALAALVLLAAYLSFLLWGAMLAVGFFFSYPPPPYPDSIRTLLLLNGGMMIWRALLRALFAGHSYGWRHGIAAIPRIFIANVITILAARRAVFLYVRSLLGRPLAWDKTEHRFPELRAQE